MADNPLYANWEYAPEYMMATLQPLIEQWEYTVCTYNTFHTLENAERYFNELGAVGWELVWVHTFDDREGTFQCIFKRRKTAD